VSYSTELWEDICEFLLYRFPSDKNDKLWDEILVEQQMLQKFSELKRLGFFNQKSALRALFQLKYLL
jgi:hypothetical protein